MTEEVASDDHGWHRNTGKVVVTGPSLRVVRADGTDHPHRHALGVFTSRPAAGAFARPRTNAPAFRQNDAVARAILTSIPSSLPHESADLTPDDGAGHPRPRQRRHSHPGPGADVVSQRSAATAPATRASRRP